MSRDKKVKRAVSGHADLIKRKTGLDLSTEFDLIPKFERLIKAGNHKEMLETAAVALVYNDFNDRDPNFKPKEDMKLRPAAEMPAMIRQALASQDRKIENADEHYDKLSEQKRIVRLQEAFDLAFGFLNTRLNNTYSAILQVGNDRKLRDATIRATIQEKRGSVAPIIKDFKAMVDTATNRVNALVEDPKAGTTRDHVDNAKVALNSWQRDIAAFATALGNVPASPASVPNPATISILR
jgi:hypothetical protein